MARPRSFDTDRALADVRDAFWARGIAATSISDLCEATGLTTGSLYKAFTDKPTLVRRVLEDYLVAGLAWTEGLLDGADSPLEGVAAWLHAIAELAASDGPTRGCFAVQCAAELAEREPDVRERIARHDARLRTAIAARLHAAREAGETTVDPEPHARLLLTLVSGLQLEARKGVSRRDARALVDAALATLNASPASASSRRGASAAGGASARDTSARGELARGTAVDDTSARGELANETPARRSAVRGTSVRNASTREGEERR